jgi:recombinational DNA repair ATPase RecF
VIFLLDDIFSYLDMKFIVTILDKLSDLNVQTWITDVRGDWVLKNKKLHSLIDKINIDDKRFKVVNNRLY